MTNTQIFGKSLSELRRILAYHEMTGLQQFNELERQRALIYNLQDRIKELITERDDLAAALADRFK